jgi:hypothetical protein
MIIGGPEHKCWTLLRDKGGSFYVFWNNGLLNKEDMDIYVKQWAELRGNLLYAENNELLY